LLGKASLEVFCTHLLFCFAALSLVKDGTGLSAWIQSAFIATTLIGLYMVARLFVNARTGALRNKARSPLPAGCKPSYDKRPLRACRPRATMVAGNGHALGSVIFIPAALSMTANYVMQEFWNRMGPGIRFQGERPH
jgi:OpgC protein